MERRLTLIAAALSLAGCTASLDFDAYEFRSPDASTSDAGADSGANTTPAVCGNGTVETPETCEAPEPAKHVTCDFCDQGCAIGFDDCNSDLANPSGNGCESSLADEATCGSCSNPCGGSQICLQESCMTPMKVGPYDDSSGSTFSIGANYAFAIPVTLVSGTRAVGIGLVLDAATPVLQMTAALYSDSGGVPSTAVASITQNTATGEHLVEFDAPYTTTGTAYWIVLRFSGSATMRGRLATPQVPVKYVVSTQGDPLPGPGTTWSDTTIRNPAAYVGIVP